MNFKKSLKLWNEGKKGMNLYDDRFSVSDRNFRITKVQGYKKIKLSERVNDIKTLMKFYEEHDIVYNCRLLLKTYETAFYFEFDMIDSNKEYSFEAKIYFGDPIGPNGLIGCISHKNKIIAQIRNDDVGFNHGFGRDSRPEFKWIEQMDLDFGQNNKFKSCAYEFEINTKPYQCSIMFVCKTYIDFVVANAIAYSNKSFKSLSEREDFSYKLMTNMCTDIPNDILKIISKYCPLDFPYFPNISKYYKSESDELWSEI